MANPELGAKQICPNCQTKFYDLNKRPAHCPKCEFEFDPEEALKSRRGVRGRPVPNYEDDKPAEKPVRDEDAEDLEDEEEVEATPEIDQAASEPDQPVDDDEDGATPEPDTGVSEDLGEEEEAEAESDDDVPFLEDEDEDEFPADDVEVDGENDREES